MTTTKISNSRRGRSGDGHEHIAYGYEYVNYATGEMFDTETGKRVHSTKLSKALNVALARSMRIVAPERGVFGQEGT